jgi:phosphoribosylanthranilate isomerase
MRARIKFCGMSRPQDAIIASELGASYVGTVFAAGPRQVTSAVARSIFDSVPSLGHVGVFDSNDPARIATLAEEADLDVVQLHADPTPEDVRAVRDVFDGEIWAAIRVSGESLPDAAADLFDSADGVLLDARGDQLGGTGRTVAWRAVAGEVARLRRGGVLILAGGLTPINVAEAISTLAPDIVDVSSGVESSPGIKSARLMREFAHAVSAGEHS